LTPRLYRLGQLATVGLTLCVSACDGGEKKQLESKLQSTQLELQQVRTHTADRDQLYSEVVDAARFVSDIQLELSKVRSRSKPKNLTSSDLEHPNRSRAELLGEVKQVLSHLDSVEQRLTRFEGKARTTDSIRAQLVSLQKTIVSLRAAALDQQTQIENLSRELATVRVERDSLATKVVGMQTTEKHSIHSCQTASGVGEAGRRCRRGRTQGISRPRRKERNHAGARQEFARSGFYCN
jgi:predicted RNase H-like nuclease (RuvC/YqgF family)